MPNSIGTDLDTYGHVRIPEMASRANYFSDALFVDGNLPDQAQARPNPQFMSRIEEDKVCTLSLTGAEKIWPHVNFLFSLGEG